MWPAGLSLAQETRGDDDHSKNADQVMHEGDQAHFRQAARCQGQEALVLAGLAPAG
jgi:hypothetical protein